MVVEITFPNAGPQLSLPWHVRFHDVSVEKAIELARLYLIERGAGHISANLVVR